MHQPVPDPIDARVLHPYQEFRWLLAVQEALARYPEPMAVSIHQQRPGVLLVADEGVYPRTVIAGMDRLVESMEERGMIQVENAHD